MAYVKNILERKGSQVWTVSPDENVRAALKTMAEKGVGALVVIEEDSIAGIFSERDYARQVAKTGDLGLSQPVRELMSHPVFFARPEQTLEECMRIMTAKHFRHLPVLEGERLVGIISIGDVVKSLISEKEMTIRGLENFIAGSSITY